MGRVALRHQEHAFHRVPRALLRVSASQIATTGKLQLSAGIPVPASCQILRVATGSTASKLQHSDAADREESITEIPPRPVEDPLPPNPVEDKG